MRIATGSSPRTGSAIRPPSAFDSAIYFGRVTHRRFFPATHRLAYRVFYLLVDLAELPELSRRIPGFSHNRPGVFSFHDRDHGPRDGSPLRPWIDRLLAEAGIDLGAGSVRILCFPRVLGYVFNPLAVWLCSDGDGALRAVLYEVSNTFGEWHGYLLPVGDLSGSSVRSRFDKELFVSPFIGMHAAYDFLVRLPDDRIAVSVRETVPQGQVLVATLTGRRADLTGGNLARAFLTYPLVTVKTIGAIHWEAARLRLKGVPYRRPGAPPRDLVTIVGGSAGVERVTEGEPL